MIQLRSYLPETVFSNKKNTQSWLKLIKGRVAIVVNVASEWGYAKYHYPQLQTMFEEYEEQGLSVLAFPCNQFGGQEPGTNEEIKVMINQIAE